MEGLVLLGGSGATAALKHAGLSGLPLGRAMTKVAAYAATHNVGGWPGTQPGTKRARTDGADGGGTSGDYDKDVKLSEGMAPAARARNQRAYNEPSKRCANNNNKQYIYVSAK